MGLKELLDVTAAGPLPPEQARAALARGQALLAAGDRDGAATALRQAALTRETQLAAHNLIESQGLPGAFAPWMGLDARIDPQDDVFGFFNGHGSWSSPLRDYLADGWRTLSELMLLLERGGKPLAGIDAVLEFASGHGRFTRHLAKALGPGRVTVSDVVPGAVAFSTTHFGVQGFVSAARPAQLHWPRRYGLVFVLSLFTHLPRATWSAWLARLWEAVAPGGVLVFTTHGALAAERAERIARFRAKSGELCRRAEERAAFRASPEYRSAMEQLAAEFGAGWALPNLRTSLGGDSAAELAQG